MRSAGAARLLIASASVGSGDLVLEIGPGEGALTKHLLACGARVVAVERDPALVSVLQETFSQEIATGDLSVYEEDVRTFLANPLPFQELYTVVANIPYYLTGALVRTLLEHPQQPQNIAFIIQKEVAERITRRKDSKESLLSLSVQFFGLPRYIKTLSRRFFSPPPSVDSAIVSISDIHAPSQPLRDTFFSLIRTAFQQKRKTVLKKFAATPSVQNLLIQHGVSATVRAEDIPFATWLAVAEQLERRGGDAVLQA